MEYGDELLNVNGFIRSKMANNISRTIEAAEQNIELEKRARKFSDDVDSVMRQIRELSEQLGADTSALEAGRDTGITKPGSIDPAIKIHLAADYDYNAAFDKLLGEAQKAGFTDVHPQDLLSSEEMERAREYSERLDARFKAATGLTSKDIAVLAIASAVKILTYYLSESAHLSAAAVGGDSLRREDSAWSGPKVQGVSDLVYAGDEVAGIIAGKGSKMSSVRDAKSILSEPVPFDVRDNEHFKRDEVLGFDSVLGWFFGVMNIMTNTVTTKRMESFAVKLSDTYLPKVGGRLSTVMQVLFPSVGGLKENKSAVIAAVVREADMLDVTHAPYDKVAALLAANMEFERQNEDLLSYGQSLNPLAGIDFAKVRGDMSVSSFINNLVAAICAVWYNPDCDGNVQTYFIRMNKIIAISNAIAAIANSIPAYASQDISRADWGGILTFCMSMFHSTRFWIQAKAEYLASEYKKEIDKQFAVLDKYFIIE